MTTWQVHRLNSKEPQEVAAALLGLYEIDTQAFRKQDQYGLDLLKLVLLQPEAFWVASLGDMLVGYFSAFTLGSNSLYEGLLKDAKQGVLDLPDLIHDYYDDLVSTTNARLLNVHIYIDAIAVPKKEGVLTSAVTEMIRHDLIDAAKNDLALVNKASLCTIAVRPGILSTVKKLGLPLDHIGGRKEAVVGDKKYRELLACQTLDTKRFNAIMGGLARIGRNIRFGVRFGVDQLRGTPTVDIFAEPKD
jgi:hypothetical protein